MFKQKAFAEPVNPVMKQDLKVNFNCLTEPINLQLRNLLQ